MTAYIASYAVVVWRREKKQAFWKRTQSAQRNHIGRICIKKNADDVDFKYRHRGPIKKKSEKWKKQHVWFC